MVRTGASAYLKYGWESTYAGSSTKDKKFGLNDALTSWTLTNNRIDLPALNSVTIDSFAYGQERGTIGVDFVLSNPWVFKSIFGDPAVTGSASPYTYTYPAAGTNPKTPTTFGVEIGIDDTADIVRTLKGCVTESLSINASVGATVNCSLSASYGKEDEPSTTLGSAPSKPATVIFPYTAAHTILTVGDNVIGQVQDASLQINTGNTLLYGFNSHQAVDSYKQLLDITGTFRGALINKVLLENVLNQISKGTAGTYSETVGGTIEFKTSFTKSASESITITGTGLSLSDIGYDGVKANEPLFENISFKLKTISIVAKNTQATED